MSRDSSVRAGAAPRRRAGPTRLFAVALAAAGLIHVLPAPADGQEADAQLVWERLQFFEGTWKGREKEAAGEGQGDRCYAFVMDGQFLAAVNTSTFELKESNPEGEVHEDWALFSYDRLRKRIVLREFHGEGYVNRYVLASATADLNHLVFVSESIENLPTGWRARITLTLRGENRFDETFELAAPGAEYELQHENRWTRSVNRVLEGA